MCSSKTAGSSRVRSLSKNKASRKQALIPDLAQSAGPPANSLAEGIRNLQPAYFALVMATGIVGIAAQLEGMPFLAKALTWLNMLAYIILWLMTVARIVLYPRELFLDLIDHSRGVGFFTVVAGTAVLGSQLVVVYARYRTAFVLWALAALLWALLTYTIFTAFTVKQQKPPFAQGINGAWLLAVVATEAVSQLATLLSPTADIHQSQLLFLALCLWLCGGMLYIWMISLIFYRYTFFVFSASDLMPPYWINMGAVAISTLAGVLLIERAPGVPFLVQMTPFLIGFTFFFWATATWWIPMLVILGVWRHGYKRFPLAYDALYWGLVFPLGMYTASTRRLSEVTSLPFLLPIAHGFIFAAIVAWLIVFVGLLHRVAVILFVKQAR